MGNGNGDDGDLKVPKYIVCGDMQKFTIEIEISRELLTSQFKERTPENDLIPEYIFQAG